MKKLQRILSPRLKTIQQAKLQPMLRATLRKAQGFTLIELIITIVVISVLIAIAGPSFVDMMQDNRDIAKVNELVGDIRLARTEAIKRRVNVRVVAASGASFKNGWIVEETTTGTDIRQAETLVKACITTSPAAATSFASCNDAVPNYAEFDSKGQLIAVPLSIFYKPDKCPSGQNKQYRINLSAFGRITSSVGACP